MAAPAILNLVLGHNFGVDQHFCTKFITVMDDEQPRVTWADITVQKIQDGHHVESRQVSVTRLWIEIFAHNLNFGYPS